MADKPYYVMISIPADTYKGVSNSTETFAVKATLVTIVNASEQMVYDVVKAVFENLDKLRNTHAAFRHL